MKSVEGFDLGAKCVISHPIEMPESIDGKGGFPCTALRFPGVSARGCCHGES